MSRVTARRWLKQSRRRRKRVKMASQRNQRGRGNRNRAAGLLAVLVLASGCANDGRTQNNDPLTGGGPPIPSKAETASSRDDRPAAVAGTPRAGVPPLPVPSSATSNAALAAGAFQPLD